MSFRRSTIAIVAVRRIHDVNRVPPLLCPASTRVRPRMRDWNVLGLSSGLPVPLIRPSRSRPCSTRNGALLLRPFPKPSPFPQELGLSQLLRPWPVGPVRQDPRAPPVTRNAGVRRTLCKVKIQ